MISHQRSLGIISLPFLALTIFARYSKHLAGAWRRIYVVGAVIAAPIRFRPEPATVA